MAAISRLWLDFLPASAVFRREFLTSLRLVRHFALMLTLVLVVILWGWFTLPETTNLSAMASWSREYFVSIVVIVAITAGFTVPAMAGSAVVSEYEGQTMEMLACTHARPWSCLAAKFVCAAGLFVLMMLAAMPAYAIVYFTAGLDMDVMSRSLAVILSWVVSMTAVGLWCSTYFRRPAFALAASYLGALFLSGLPYILFCLVCMLLRIKEDEDLIVVGIYFTPVLSLVDVFEGAPSNVLSGIIRGSTANTIVHVLLALFFLWLAGRQLHRNWSHGAPVIVTPKARKEKKSRKVRSSDGGESRLVRWLDPIVFKDVICELGLFSRSGRMTRWAALFVCGSATGVLLLMKAQNSSDYDEALMAWMALQSCLVLLVTPPFAIHLFSKERARETMDGLRNTLLKDWEVVRGKMWASWVAGGQIVGVAVMAALPLFFWEDPYTEVKGMLFWGLVMMAVSVWLALAVSLLCSLLVDKLGASLTLAYLLLMFASLGLFLLLTVFDFAIRGGRRDGDHFYSSPILAYLENHNHLKVVLYPGMPQPPTTFLVSLVIWLAIGGLAYAVALFAYRSRYGRTHQPGRGGWVPVFARLCLALFCLVFSMSWTYIGTVQPEDYYRGFSDSFALVSGLATVALVAGGVVILLPGMLRQGEWLVFAATATLLTVHTCSALGFGGAMAASRVQVASLMAIDVIILGIAVWLMRNTREERTWAT